MGKVWDYVTIRSKAVLSTKQVMLATTAVVGLVHVGLLLFFAYYKVFPLVMINIFSVLLYALCFIQVCRDKNLLVIFNCAYVEIIFHAMIATVLVGRDSGFMLYLVAMLPIGFYIVYNFRDKKERITPMFYVLLNGVFFCVTQVVCSYVSPLYTYGDKQVDRIIYMANYFTTVVAIVAFLSTLLNQIKILEELQKGRNRKLEILSQTDLLTGLVNRRSIQERYKQSEQLQESYAVVLGDIDDFKKINDTYGHNVGDKVLKAVADAFKETVSESGIVCRWGGEEILVFLPEYSCEEALPLAEKILENIRNLQIEEMNEFGENITMTLGVAFSAEATKFDEVIRKADQRLYDGKNTGKNKVVRE